MASTATATKEYRPGWRATAWIAEQGLGDHIGTMYCPQRGCGNTIGYLVILDSKLSVVGQYLPPGEAERATTGYCREHGWDDDDSVPTPLRLNPARLRGRGVKPEIGLQMGGAPEPRRMAMKK